MELKRKSLISNIEVDNFDRMKASGSEARLLIDSRRAIIGVYGADALQFLQNLSTNDMQVLKNEHRCDSLALRFPMQQCKDLDDACDDVIAKDLDRYIDSSSYNNDSIVSTIYSNEGNRTLNCGLSQYNLLLSRQGKILYDFFAIYCDKECFQGLLPADVKILLDVSCDYLQDIIDYLLKFKLRSDVSFIAMEDLLVGYCNAEYQQQYCRDYNLAFAAERSTSVAHALPILFFEDSRYLSVDSVMPYRVLLNRQSADYSKVIHPYETNNLLQLCVYDEILMRAALPTFGVDFGPDVYYPSELGLDRLAVSYSKGCYLGQEVTTRMHLVVGQKRKIYSIAIDYSSFSEVKFGDDVDLPLNTYATRSKNAKNSLVMELPKEVQEDTLSEEDKRAIADNINSGTENCQANSAIMLCNADRMRYTGVSVLDQKTHIEIGQIISILGGYALVLLRLGAINSDIDSFGESASLRKDAELFYIWCTN